MDSRHNTMRMALVCASVAGICLILVVSRVVLFADKIDGTFLGPRVHKNIGYTTTLVPAQPNHTVTGATDSVCELPVGGFKSWKDGVVTVVKPMIERNCTKIFAGDQREVERVMRQNLSWTNEVSDHKLLQMVGNCSWVREYLHDVMYTTKLEKSFPIAYTFVVYESPQQVLRLLKVLYRPTHYYCIHPDKKFSLMVSFFSKLAACLDNVIIPLNVIEVAWGHYSLLEAQLSCLSDLVQWREKLPEERKWKYVINLCGKELPLVSTHATVSALLKLNGTSSIITEPRLKKGIMKRLNNMTVPNNITVYKSLTFVALSHQFILFLLTNPTAVELRFFFKGCRIPEEFFYATIYMLPGVPGGYDPKLRMSYFDVAGCIWLHGHTTPCNGKRVHWICIVSVGDMKLGAGETSPHGLAAGYGGVRPGEATALFHNKYFMEFDHTVMDCMEERLVGMNRLEYQQDCGS